MVSLLFPSSNFGLFRATWTAKVAAMSGIFASLTLPAESLLGETARR
jgi:hypothetical protein